jgi:hypothetical protein
MEKRPGGVEESGDLLIALDLMIGKAKPTAEGAETRRTAEVGRSKDRNPE